MILLNHLTFLAPVTPGTTTLCVGGHAWSTMLGNGQYHVVNIMWSISCGQYHVVNIMWSISCGQYHVVNIMWLIQFNKKLG